MTRATLLALMILPGLLATYACDSNGGGIAETFCDTPTPKLDGSGKLAGELCDKNEDCASNVCSTDALASPTTKICVRSCAQSCGTAAVQCSSLGIESQGISYTAIFPRAAVSNSPLCHCVPVCSSVADCKQFGDAYDRCELPGGTGATKACVISALGGGPGGGDGSGGGSDATGGGDGTSGDAVAVEDTGSTSENPTPGCYKLEDAPYPDGLLHGEPCSSHQDCLYGLCEQDTPNLTAGAFKVCTKKCGGCDSGFASACADDDAPQMFFTCVKTRNSKDEHISHCARRCDSASGFPGVESCQTLFSDYTSCNAENAGKEYCGAL